MQARCDVEGDAIEYPSDLDPLYGEDTDILYPNPMFETELCDLDPREELERVRAEPGLHLLHQPMGIPSKSASSQSGLEQGSNPDGYQGGLPGPA